MKFISFVRFTIAQQVEDLSGKDTSWADLCCNSLPKSYHSYTLISFGILTETSAGRRFSLKSMAPEKALPYLNKLSIGGWISDDDYNSAFGATYRLLQKNRGLLTNACLAQIGED